MRAPSKTTISRRLQDASKMHLCASWLLASRTDNKIPWDAEWIATRINATAEVDLTALQDAGSIELIADASNTLATRKQSALSERESEKRVRVREREQRTEKTRVLAAKNGKPRATTTDTWDAYS